MMFFTSGIKPGLWRYIRSMMSVRSRYLLASLIVALSTTCAQNLVVNGSFEEYTECPPSFGYWANVVGWISPYTQSADYYNACASGIVCSVPLNYGGYQFAADGDAYMGIITYSSAVPYREVVATQLTEALMPGVPTFVSYKISSGGGGSNINNTPTWAAKGPGMNFFTQLPETSQPWLFSGWASYLFPNYAMVDMPGVLNDTVNWVTVSGVFVPDSAYTWLAIANYFENELSQLELLDSTAQSHKAYANIEEDCVSQVPGYCDGSTDLAGTVIIRPPVRCFLANGMLTVWGADAIQNPHLSLTNAHGQLVWQEEWGSTGNMGSVPIPDLATGIYLLTIKPQQGVPHTLRVVHSLHP